MAWYAIKRELRPINFGISRTVEFKEPILLPESGSSELSDEERMKERKQIYSTSHAYGKKVVTLDIWGVNSDLKTHHIPLKIQHFEISTGRMVFESDRIMARLLPNQSTEILKMGNNITEDDSPNLVVSVEYQTPSGEILRSSADWPQPLKYVDFSGRKVTCSVENEKIRVEADKPVKGVILDVEGDDDSELEWSDNGFDVMSGEVVNIIAEGLNGRNVIVNWYGE